MTDKVQKFVWKNIICRIKKKLGRIKGYWVEELSEVLWSYNPTTQSSASENPHRLVYGVEAMMFFEIIEPSLFEE
ncbi:hypothetical protein Cni_G09560 [Canna indica]|uniref:Uncharacterized protein n=1 Tax=Canna indica TaxID=4628 RepID=A0AAQ3K2Q5_9LILI|nr:hypothetical protein Cni_G09560 [Canna indica]